MPDQTTDTWVKNLLVFGRTCKAAGMDVTPETLYTALQALNLVRLDKRDDVYHVLRAIYVKRRRDLMVFDEIFTAFWRNLYPEPDANTGISTPPSQGKPLWTQPGTMGGDSTPDDPITGVISTYSPNEILRHKDFAAMSAEELTLVYDWVARLNWSLGARLTRRFVRGDGRKRHIDLRRAMRQNLRYAGEFIELPTRRRKIKQRSILLLCDISGSMERYTHILLHLMHILSQTSRHVEAFVFGTRLTRVTPAMRQQRLHTALDEIGTSVKDWSGGTRIGDALYVFNRRWRWHCAGTNTVVLLITDGWDRGDPDLLRRETALLQRSSYRFVWLNPLLGIPAYEPLTRGAQAMINSVDDFLPVHNLASLEALVSELARVDWKRRPTNSKVHHV